jgi:uncharacterized membrane protein YhaH (DUF805 family)
LLIIAVLGVSWLVWYAGISAVLVWCCVVEGIQFWVDAGKNPPNSRTAEFSTQKTNLSYEE